MPFAWNGVSVGATRPVTSLAGAAGDAERAYQHLWVTSLAAGEQQGAIDIFTQSAPW